MKTASSRDRAEIGAETAFARFSPGKAASSRTRARTPYDREKDEYYLEAKATRTIVLFNASLGKIGLEMTPKGERAGGYAGGCGRVGRAGRHDASLVGISNPMDLEHRPCCGGASQGRP